MKKAALLSLTMLLCASLFCSVAVAQDDGDALTPQQVKKLAKLYDRLYQDHVKLIELYAEYGKITPEQKQEKLERLQRHHEWLKAHQYDLDACKKFHRHHHHKHRQDQSQWDEQGDALEQPAETS